MTRHLTLFIHGVCSLLFLFISVTCHGQKDETGEMGQLYHHIIIFISKGDRDSALYYANQFMDKATQVKDEHGIALAWSEKSQIARHLDNDIQLTKQYGEEALFHFDRTKEKEGLDTVYSNLFFAALYACNMEQAMDYSEKYYEEAKLKNDQNGIYASLNGMFALNCEMGNYEKSFDYAQQLYDIAIKTGNKLWIANALWNLAKLYTLIEDYPDALGYFRRVWEMSDQGIINDRIQMEKEILFGIEFGETFSKLQQFDSAWHYFKLSRPSNHAFNAIWLVSTGETYFQQGNFEQAALNFRESLDANRKHGNVKETMRSLLDLANVWLALDSISSAIHYGREGLQLALQTGVNQYKRDGYKILSDAYGRLGRTDSSDFYFRKYSIVKDVVLDDQAKGKIAAYNYAGRIENINKEKKIGEIELQKQTLFKNILIGAILILILMAFFIFRNAKLSRKYEARRRELAENELRIQKLESEKSRAELLQQQTELEMKALRAQMNPHFIFNCLNSINQFIAVNDVDKATDYLTKFARLIRMVLEKSGKSFIPLDQELNALKLYMDLEAIRFEKPFHYNIENHGIDESSVLIPSLLIQPFVENAIWHGLYPKKGTPGIINIDLSLDKNILHCEITDNGIGMEKAAAIKTYGSGSKKSMGFEITAQRLKLADSVHPENSGYSIQDIKDESGQNAGTRVSINISVKNY